MNDDKKAEMQARKTFSREVSRFGFPSYGSFCAHGVPGGLHCGWCGDVDRLHDSEKLRGKKGVPARV